MFDTQKLKWIRKPEHFLIEENRIEIISKPHTDLWQNTYYHFCNDNAPLLLMETEEKYFSFTVKTSFDSRHRFDQCGIVIYQDAGNWLKASVEYENDTFSHLGSVVTNQGYSDWATMEIDASIKEIYYRLSRREEDFRLEYSTDGIRFCQMRICHLVKAEDPVSFGVYACSPEDSSFKAVFTEMDFGKCLWKAHDGQQPDKPKGEGK
jgi:hypothetical protein